MCAQLGMPEKYSPTTALLFIRFGKNGNRTPHRPWLYTAYVTHGSGGGRKEGGKVNRLADLASIVDADIYIHAHTSAYCVQKFIHSCMQFQFFHSNSRQAVRQHGRILKLWWLWR